MKRHGKLLGLMLAGCLLGGQPALAEDRSRLLQQQLQASQERREDLTRARDDARRLSAAPLTVVADAPRGLLEIDALRREVQQIDAARASSDARLEVLQQERAAAANRLQSQAARLRRLEDGGERGDALAQARVEAKVSQSEIAELDLLVELTRLQQRIADRRQQADLRRLAKVRGSKAPSAAEIAQLHASLDARQTALRQRLQTALAARSAARAHAGSDEFAREALINGDMDIEFTRQALADLVLEREAWDMSLRFQAVGDTTALVEARQRGPALRASLQRRREFLQSLSAQVLERVGSLDAEIAAAASPAQAKDRQQLRELLLDRLDRVQAAMLEERQLSSLLERLRADFDGRADMAGWRERFDIALASVRAWGSHAWNFELFSVQDDIEVDGRKTKVDHGVSFGTLVKAPLLLLLGWVFSRRVAGWGTTWLQRRRGVDEARARLLQRWLTAALLVACTLASLVVAGIPLAAFAFIGGAVAIGAGIGTQTLFKNLVSGVLVLIERPFRLGDVIEVGGLRGTVVDIDLRASVLRDDEGAESLVPNSILIEQNVRNMTFRSRRAKQALALQVAPGVPPRQVMDVMRESASRHGQLLDSPAPEVLLQDAVGDSLEFVLHYWLELKPGIERRRIASDLRLMILGAFEEAGIVLALPPRTG